MRNGLFVLAVTCLALGACDRRRDSDATSQLDPSQFVGSWDLVAYDRRDQFGNVAEAYYGDDPLGHLIYTASGDMSVHLVDPRIGSFESGDFLNGTSEEIESAYEGYFGYFGTYSVDVEARTVTHHVIGASFRGYTNSDMVRNFELSGDTLSLVSGVEIEGGVPSTFHLIWERRE